MIKFLEPFIQWLHVASVVLMIGGFFFFRVVLIPIANRFPEPINIILSALKRFSRVVWITLLTVLISGIYNFISFLRTARITAEETEVDYSLYILMLGIKFFIVFLIYTVAVVLTFPYPVFEGFQKKPTPWLNIIIVLGLVIIFLSAFLRRLSF